MSTILEVLTKLIQFQSITPDDQGCQNYMMDVLTQLGFHCQRFNNAPVSNFFARIGSEAPLFVFAGHTDVVPIGDLSKWASDPFILHEKEGMLYGRGTADMKGSLACMIIAVEQFITNHPQFSGSIGFLITSGEEGDDYDKGTPYVMAALLEQGIKLDYCIVGEPSSTLHMGDVVKIGRRGSLNGKLVLEGIQGHVAYPHLADNPIHRIAAPLKELTDTCWDNGNEYFPPTSLQVTHLHASGQTNNIIPGNIAMHFNFRYSTEQTEETLKAQVHACFERFGLNPSVEWRLSGEPFLTSCGALLENCVQVIQECTGQAPQLSTSGGTSDGRFIAPYGVEVIELGPINATIHQVNECVSLEDLNQLTTMYYALCERLTCSPKHNAINKMKKYPEPE